EPTKTRKSPSSDSWTCADTSTERRSSDSWEFFLFEESDWSGKDGNAGNDTGAHAAIRPPSAPESTPAWACAVKPASVVTLCGSPASAPSHHQVHQVHQRRPPQ
ncbi:ARFGAP1 isoform 24, partial [Pan troglodytes]